MYMICHKWCVILAISSLCKIITFFFFWISWCFVRHSLYWTLQCFHSMCRNYSFHSEFYYFCCSFLRIQLLPLRVHSMWINIWTILHVSCECFIFILFLCALFFFQFLIIIIYPNAHFYISYSFDLVVVFFQFLFLLLNK